MKILVAIFSLMFFLPQAWADWELLRSTDNSNVYYFKKNSYKGFFGDVTFATLVDLKTPKLNGDEPYMSIYTKFEIDCSKRRTRFLDNKFYSKNMKEGRVVTDSGKSDWFGASEVDMAMFCKK